MAKRDWSKNRTDLPMGVPMVAADPVQKSRALGVHPDQVAEANRAAQGMGCGAPFTPDGKFVGRRSEVKRYVSELNRRQADAGQPRIVNYDGGHGDPT